MFGLFGKKNKKTAKPQKPRTRQDLINEAMANARKAREEIGEENIQKMAQMLKEQQAQNQPQAEPPIIQPEINHVIDNTQPSQPFRNPNSEASRAREQIRHMDGDVIADHLRDVIKD
jgi:hypothetical protein